MLCATLGTLSQDPLETNAPSPRLVLHLSTLWFLTRYGTSCRVESREGGCVTRGHTDTFPWHVVTQLVTIYKMCSKVDNQISEGGISHQRVRGECLEGRTQHLNTSGFPAWRFLHTGPKKGHYSPTCPGSVSRGSDTSAEYIQFSCLDVLHTWTEKQTYRPKEPSRPIPART